MRKLQKISNYSGASGETLRVFASRILFTLEETLRVCIVTRIIRLTLELWVLSILILLPTAVLAHDGSTRIVLNQYEIAQGHNLEVSGINLGTDLVVQIQLIGGNTAVLLGEALCDGHGDFIQQFSIPAELPDGIYTIQAIDTSIAGPPVVMAETPFKVSATAVSSPNNEPQISTFIHDQPNWQQPLFAGLALLTFILLLSPSLIKWRRGKLTEPLPKRSHLQK